MRPPALLSIGWLLAGLSWAAAVFLPWTSRGLLSHSSLLDAALLVRQGVVDDVVPAGAAFLLLFPAVVGLLLVALAGLGGQPAAVARPTIGVLGTALVVVLVGRLTGWSAGRAGPGVVAALVGVALVLATGITQLVLARTPRATPSAQ